MKANEVKVTFQPFGRSVFVLPGTLLLEAAGRAGIILKTPCGGKGTCGKCKVKVCKGKVSTAERPASKNNNLFLEEGYCLACQAYVEELLTVEVPAESMFETDQPILTADTGAAHHFRPVNTKKFFTLDVPTSKASCSDVERFRDSVGDVTIPYDLLKKLPHFLRKQQWQGTAVLADSRLIALEKGDTSEKAFGVAFDIGTTTVVGTLFDLKTGRELGVASQINPQVGFGDDVIARILRLRENDGALGELQQTILKAVNSIISTLAEQGGISAQNIYDIVIAGNSTMQQILCGLDSSALGEIPFVQVFSDPLVIPASHLGMAVNPCAEVFIFPQIGGFVGGDTVAGMLATRLNRAEFPSMLIDIGTNGEIVLVHEDRILATSTAAGPALEGARITQGMRAATGAIEKVVIRDDVLINVIGNSRASGICGTALIDTVAELLRCGIVDEMGRILSPEELPSDLPNTLRDRISGENGMSKFILAEAQDSVSGEPIYLWQKDIRELQLAAGAIRAGTNILLHRAGLKASDIGRVLLAGAFGNFIRRSNARRIGLLPEIPCERIRFIGNAASLGAKLALLSADEREYASTLCRKTEHVDLSLEPEFQMQFASAMIFPDRDIDACPSDTTGQG